MGSLHAPPGDAPKITKEDNSALWHAVEAFRYAVQAMRGMDFTPEQVQAEQDRLTAARRALRKVQAIRRAQRGERAKP